MSANTPSPAVVNTVITHHTLSDFDFELPPELIAQHPAPERSGSRLLDGTPTTGEPTDRIFRDLHTLLRAGDLVVFNDTKVINARLFGNKPPPPGSAAARVAAPHGGEGDLGRPGVALPTVPTGGKVELLIERVLGGNQVAAHMRVSKKPEVGTTLTLIGAPGTHENLRATLLGRWPEEEVGGMFRFVLSNDAGDDPYTLMERHGHVPLPPYITHSDSAEDALRYQTVFAKNPGAVAAPTAALHFAEALLAQLDAMGVQQAHVTLHVGAGTFQPVKTENLAEHQMHSEWYAVPESTQQAIAACKARGGRIVAVGTTTVRTLESWAHSGVARGDTRIFITPGFEFKLIDLLVTNFHLPKSSLMMLVSAFAGYDHIMALYRTAIARQYRFFSYGDAMLLARQTAGPAAGYSV
ncbi:MAG: tRNA preQ1(34) S-adenosylmethionine ribosyltransferase-isomerase QueA [Burkholderiales bacterium]|nr:tRNA preQ1(34) S-adenosylmethionine ribosyltransferase-isomerase QueA [Burkholderiales bacterium]